MSIFRNFGITVIRLYQWCISPWLGTCCRFSPTCSHYAIESLQRHGVCRGSWFTLCRLLRCHPLGGSGCDPVPPSLPMK